MSTEKNGTLDINDVVTKYSDELSRYGVKCALKEKHFQLHYSHEPHTNANAGLFFTILDKAKHKLRLKFLPFKDDDYKCVVIRFEPINSALKNGELKEYAFVKSYREDIKKRKDKSTDIPAKTERLIKKIIKRLNKSSADKVCKDTVFDILRYTTQIKYSYKKQILGYDKNILDTAVSIFFLFSLAVISALILIFL